MKNITLKVIAGIAYIAMVAVNVLANALPINNRSTGDVSNAYPNLFAPSGFTFSVWGLIYLLLAGYVLYQFTKQSQKREVLLRKINTFFIGTSLANSCWIFAWHYDVIGASVFIIALLLLFLIKIADALRTEKLTTREKAFISVPFGVYFGWITVASIANVTVFLVSIGWSGFGIADSVWTGVVLLVGALIGVLRMRKDRNVAYGLVLIWAYLGILLKHTSIDGFHGRYPGVIAMIVTCLVLLVFFTGKLFHMNNKSYEKN